MSLRTNPDRILENIDRQRSRADEGLQGGLGAQAIGRELDTELPEVDATNPERIKRLFAIVERGYMAAAQGSELKKLADRFRAVGDIPDHRAHGDVSVSVQYIDSARPDDVAMAPFEIVPARLVEAKKETKTSRPDINAMKVLRIELRNGVLAAYKKVEPRLRDALRDRADMGHVAVQITMAVRPVESVLLANAEDTPAPSEGESKSE